MYASLHILQVFYYLGELNDSLSYALGAGPLFDVSEDSDYVHTLLGESYNLYFYKTTVWPSAGNI